jgi:hypothetical protein
MYNKFPSLFYPWFQLQIELQRAMLGEEFWRNAAMKVERMPQKPGGINVPVVYDKFSGK